MISKILNVGLAIVVVILALELSQAKRANSDLQNATDTTSTLNVIAQRSSIRAYSDQPVEDEKVTELLRAAMAAPTARDCRPWAFIVIKDSTLLKTIADSLPNSKMAAKARLAIAVCGDMTKAMKGGGRDFWIQDASAATENLLLAATAQGLGAVWTGIFPNEERTAITQRILNLPEHIIPLNIIPLGYPAGEATPKDKWNPENIHYDRW